MNILTVYSVLFYVVMSTSLISFFGFSHQVAVSSFLIFVLGIINLSVANSSNFGRDLNLNKKGLFAFFILVLIKLSLDQFNQIIQLFILILIPVFHSLNLKRLDEISKNIVFKSLLLFFILECFLAIFEKITGVLLFTQNEDSLEQLIEIQRSEFRSSSLLGHPLNNALCVSVLMSAILLSDIRKYLRLCLLLIGFLALICFDARASVIIWVAIFLLHSYKYFKKSSGFYLVFGLSLSYYLLVNFQLSGRLFNSELLDESALTRFSVFNTFNYLSGYNLWFGDSSLYLIITGYLGAGGIENSFVVFVVNFGIIGTTIIVSFYKHYFAMLLHQFRLYSKLILLVAFVLLGSTNNGLLNPLPLILFISCLYCFPFSSIYKN